MRLRQRRADVRRHVVGTFQRMAIAWVVFRNEPLEEIRHVEHHVRVDILLDHQRRRGVLDEDSQYSRLGAGGCYGCRYKSRNLASEGIKTLPASPNFQAMRVLRDLIPPSRS